MFTLMLKSPMCLVIKRLLETFNSITPVDITPSLKDTIIKHQSTHIKSRTSDIHVCSLLSFVYICSCWRSSYQEGGGVLLTPPHFHACPKARIWHPNVMSRGLFCVRWVTIRGDYSFCWPSIFNLSFHNLICSLRLGIEPTIFSTGDNAG